MSTQFSSIWPYRLDPIRVIVDLEAMEMKEYSAFSKAPALLEPLHQIYYIHLLESNKKKQLLFSCLANERWCSKKVAA